MLSRKYQRIFKVCQLVRLHFRWYNGVSESPLNALQFPEMSMKHPITPEMPVKTPGNFGNDPEIRNALETT